MAYQIRQEMCSCCHRCRVLCPQDAVTFKGVKYWIDPEKCVECGLCAENCHNCAIILPGAEPELPAAHEPKILNCDVAVCGGGGSGLVAAVRMAQAGKRVIILEKNRHPGGNTWYAGGFHGHYSKLEEAAGVPDTREAQIQRFLENTEHRTDPELTRNVFYASGELVDFLIEHCDCDKDFTLGKTPFGMGVRFQNNTGTKYERIDASIGPGGMGSFVVEKLLGQCEKLNIPVLTEHEAKELLQSDGGQVLGVRASDGGGDVIVNAKAVILSTGCYSHNPEYQAKANPEIPKCTAEPLHLFSIPTCTGDGITMAEKAGAKIDWENAKAMIIGPAHHPFGFAGVCLCREDDVVLINKEGRRWASEVNNTMGLRFKILSQPDRIAWAIMDQHMLDTLADRLVHSPRSDQEHAAIIANYQQEVDAEALMDTPLKKADTLEELARLMGVPEDVFTAEIRHYNDMCHAGVDTDFGKPKEHLMALEQGPYYAFYEKLFQENASGGIQIDPETRVVGRDGTVIPGLYAAGDTSTGLLIGSGEISDYVEREVSMLTWALTSGYMAAGAVLKDL